MPLERKFSERLFCGPFLLKRGSGSTAVARLQREEGCFVSVFLEKGLDFKPGEHAV
jgi:hypothetical protein